MTTTLEHRLRSREAVVGVIGLGYVGLPLAVAFAEVGFKVVGFDVSDAAVDGLNAGRSHIDDISSSRVASLVSGNAFRATSDVADLKRCDALFICVPTPFDKLKTPDLSYVEAATRTVAKVLRTEMLVILQSTTYPGTTTEFVRPILEEDGLVAGRDFHLAFSPERVDPGNTTWNVRNTPKVVGGLSGRCTELAAVLLESLMEDPSLVRRVESPEVAEMAKLLENTYRAVNVALVNEFAKLCHQMEIDVWNVIEAAASKPFGFQTFTPGIGPGGHCIPVDPLYLAWKARRAGTAAHLLELAVEINDSMAEFVVARIMQCLARPLAGAKILCLGAAFKPGVSDTRNSRALRVMELLTERAALISFCDPRVGEIEINGVSQLSVPLSAVATTNADLVVVLVGGDWPLRELEARQIHIFDAVNAGQRISPFTERL
ncbi:MAG: nucleotide sugar dehydrogenase [Actinobacteria bacterium]|nr:nucleotide sugar dehydrogenase [Actinomycetota bacterium]